MIKLPPLPYKYDELLPALPAHQVECHYDKHTRKYYDAVNELIKGTVYENVTDIATILNKKTLASADSVLFNNLAQAWNHTFYWNCLAPISPESTPSPSLTTAIDHEFGSIKELQKRAMDKANHHFGSGWLWLVQKSGKLVLKTTPNAGTPLTTDGEHPLFVIDLWEHAYLYSPEYAADKSAYLEAVWKQLNWNFINDNYTTQ